MRCVLVVAFLCASAWWCDAAHVLTYDGNKGYFVSKPVLAKATKCTMPSKTKELNNTPISLRTITTPAPASACDAEALKAEIPKVLEKLIENKLKNTKDPAQQCFFSEADMKEVGLEKYVQVANFIGTKKLCLWSGLTTPNSQDYIDNKSGCMRLENTPLGNYLEVAFNKKEGDKNYPKNALDCHKNTNWEIGGTRWPGLKIDGMHFLRALWSYGSKNIALQVDGELITVLNKAGNFKGNFNGDVFSLIEFPALVKEGKIKKVHIKIFEDATDFKENSKELRERKYTCTSAEYKTMKADAMADLRIDEKNFTCEDGVKI
ncbi:uncharacterized protein LOC129588376 [Paramacrobiotus metropolitanus]|uniref:uncharacterized protein LOC129588376 n=1 Tax=Paramacrobiotus metropolitanus TaxID=2943436 RepID=UPI00244650F7|nr:uncharacterized protein LOC129588376 [Paramacrobiotus metropolitanus]